MKTLILSMSPRKSFSASMYYSRMLKFFMRKGTVELQELKTQKQYLSVLDKLDEIDNLVLVSPVYVDTIPSTVLEKLVKLEEYTKDKKLNINLYTITNCGFYEPQQGELAQKTFENWSEKCNFNFKGGLSIGAGVMLAFIRTLIPIGIVLTLIETIIFGLIALFTNGTITINDLLHVSTTLLVHIVLYILWSIGLFIASFKMAKEVNKSKQMGIKYVTLWFCPRFMFVIIASIYWIIASIFWYKGKFWRILKEPNIKIK